jgi:hypothetical protein
MAMPSPPGLWAFVLMLPTALLYCNCNEIVRATLKRLILSCEGRESAMGLESRNPRISGAPLASRGDRYGAGGEADWRHVEMRCSRSCRPTFRVTIHGARDDACSVHLGGPRVTDALAINTLGAMNEGSGCGGEPWQACIITGGQRRLAACRIVHDNRAPVCNLWVAKRQETCWGGMWKTWGTMFRISCPSHRHNLVPNWQ